MCAAKVKVVILNKTGYGSGCLRTVMNNSRWVCFHMVPGYKEISCLPLKKPDHNRRSESFDFDSN